MKITFLIIRKTYLYTEKKEKKKSIHLFYPFFFLYRSWISESPNSNNNNKDREKTVKYHQTSSIKVFTFIITHIFHVMSRLAFCLYRQYE